MVPDRKQKKVKFEIVEGSKLDFDPKDGTIRLGSVFCPVCKEGTYSKTEIKGVIREEGFGQQPLAVVLFDPKHGRRYRLFTESDLTAYSKAVETRGKLDNTSGERLRPVPDEPISTDYDWVLKPPMFGLTKWGDIFNPRQTVSLVCFIEKVRRAHELILRECGDQQYARAVTTYLALAVDRLADFCSTLCVLNNVGGRGVVHTFGRQALSIAWDYAESNPLNPIGANWTAAIVAAKETIEATSIGGTVDVRQGNATRLPYDNGYFDAVITDPPYYDSVPYSDLSDFFYVWLKRSVGDLYPELFSTLLAPKSEELVEQSGRVTSAAKRTKDKNFYESGIARALLEVNRVLKDTGICVVVFAHKNTSAWETLIGALLGAGFAVTSSWPIHTERPGRLRAHGSAALASSVWLVCRKRSADAGTGSWKSVQTQLDKRVKERLEYFLGEGIKGADALLSAIGPALEIFGRYERVEKITGENVTITEFLDKVREAVAHHALSTVLSEQELGNVDAPTALYVLWKWTFEPTGQNGKSRSSEVKGKGNENHILVPYDEALKLARSVGADPDLLLKSHILRQEKEYLRLLDPNERKRLPGLGEAVRDGTPPTTIDMIHRALNLWAAMEQAQLEEYLDKSGAKNSETFWRVTQALSNLLPLQSKEKQLLDGLLARHAGGAETVRPRDLRSLDEFVKKEEK
jgi:adenine-specific DNA methylase